MRRTDAKVPSEYIAERAGRSAFQCREVLQIAQREVQKKRQNLGSRSMCDSESAPREYCTALTILDAARSLSTTRSGTARIRENFQYLALGEKRVR